MSRLKTLLKYNFLRLVSVFQGKEKRKSVKSGIAILTLASLVILAVYSFQTYSMFAALPSELCLYHAGMTALTVLLIMGITRAASSKAANDEDLLLSLPIKKHEIVINKSLGMYALDFALMVLLYLPFAIMYMCFQGFNIWVCIFALLLTLILPLFSVGLSYIFRFITANIFNKSRFANLYKTFVVVFIFIATVLLLLSKTFGYQNVQVSTMEEYFASGAIINLFRKFVLYQDPASIFIVLGVVVGVFALGASLYASTLGKKSIGFVNKKKALKFSKRKSVFFSMFKKELGAYSQSVAFVVNTIIGPIFMLAYAILVAAYGGASGLSALLGVPVDSNTVFGISILVLLGMVTMTPISCCTISLEGKNFWILKSNPINERHILYSKSAVQLAITLPALIVSLLILIFALQLSAVQILTICGVTLCFNVASAFAGVLINIFFPKFDWDDDVQVVKQGIAVLIYMVFGLILTVLPVLLYVLVLKDILLTALITLGLYALLMIVSIVLTNTVGVKKFREL